ncbi:MAG: DciA family protein [Trueperaceae bacterium]|nr:DciA family protein [Trueperaceae bacterium]
MPEKHVRDLISEVFRRGGMRRAVRRAEAVLAWPRIVGAKMARFTTARALEGGVLFVDVPDSETAMHLSLQREQFLEAYRERFGQRDVRDIRFRAGRPSAAEAPPAPPAPPAVDEAESSALERELGRLDLPDGVAGPTLAAAHAMLRHRVRARADGWTPCPHCGALSPGTQPCDACRRHRAAPRVVRAAEGLALDPTLAMGAFGDDERAVARDLAVERLDARMLELLPEVLASPRLAPQLAAAARNRVALARGCDPFDVNLDDVGGLDPRVARALRRWA